jgi:hypothetical protein
LTDAVFRIEDVEKDVTLPPLMQQSVYLDLDPYSLVSYNVMQAVFAINAVDSERTDKVRQSLTFLKLKTFTLFQGLHVSFNERKVSSKSHGRRVTVRLIFKR